MIIVLITILGFPLGLLVYAFVQIIKNPNNADKYVALVTKPIYYFFNWGSKKYIASEVSYQVTEYFNRHVISNIANQSDIKIQINWMLKNEEPILKEDNTVIIRLKKDKDQAKNILKAAETTIPLITYANLRTNIENHLSKSIDLISLRRLAKLLGNHGKSSYKRHFLDPLIELEPRIVKHYQKLVEVDNRGFFLPIFLNEIEYISDGIFADGDLNDYTNEIIEFIEYLVHISKIEVGDDVRQWSHFSEIFNAGIMLLANNQRMISQGLKPYLDRITKNLKQGHESIYIIAEENSWEFLQKLIDALDQNDRVLIKGTYKISGIVENNSKKVSKVKILLLRKIDILADDLFRDKVEACDIKVGNRIEGEVIDVYEQNAIVSLLGIDAFIKKNECSWYKTLSCHEYLSQGQRIEFLIKNIDEQRNCVELSLKFEENDPWKIEPRPKLNDVLSLQVLNQSGKDFIGRNEHGYEIIVPKSELSWFDTIEGDNQNLINDIIEVIIYDINEEKRFIKASVKRAEQNPWPEINKRIRPDTEFVGTVTEVNPHFIRINISDGLNGIIPKERLVEYGGLYKNFTENIIVGQKIEVIVTKVFVAKHKIHLNIKG